MKALKISLVVILVAAIGAGIFFGIQNIKEPEKVKESENQFTHKIEQQIDQLKTKPENKFCKDFYKEIASNINDFYNQNRFGNNQLENDQWKENLEKNLYSAYAEKFITQAKTVFRGSQWIPNDLQFIQAEKNDLKKSKLLVGGSPVDKEFTSIQTALNKYNEIESFISSCKGYSYSETDLSARFPIADVQSKISRAELLLQKRLENNFVNNCTRLHDGLKNIPSFLFSEHVKYLENKIKFWSGMYSGYGSQKDYSNLLYKPLKTEIEALDNDLYNVSNFDNEYERLLNKWSDDNINAYDFQY